MPVVSNVSVFGLEESIRAAKYPKSTDVGKLNSEVTPGIARIAAAPIGSGHDNFLQGIIVQFDLTFSNKAWVEAERYHFLDFVSSQSTMHKIAQMDIDAQCNEYVSTAIKMELKWLIDRYNGDPTPDNYLRVLYNVPSGFRLTARMTTNYRQLKTIYQQRKTHRLPEWREFCGWMRSLPHSEWITGDVSEP